MPFEVTILGSNSAIPVYGRHHTAQYVKIQNSHFLVDCGEGTQLQLQRFGLKAQKIDAIFISHLHGDHYLGLLGLLSSMHLQGRTRDLHLFGQPPLGEILTTQLHYSDTTLRYRVHFHPLSMDKEERIFENKKLRVSSIPLQHRVPCAGFVFHEKQHPVRLNKQTLPKDIKLTEIATLRKGEDVFDQHGKVKYGQQEYTLGRKKTRSYAYLTDTIYMPELAKSIHGVDMLYHEATFLTEKELKATKTFHATAGQAAHMAKEAHAETLLIGHFSARYKELKPLEDEARKVFENTYLAIEGKTFSIKH